MARKGRDLEKLVSAIERIVSRDASVKVESPKLLKDRQTGKLREHDVVLTIQQGHHEILVAIECRDRKRPVGVPDVEQFAFKCAQTGVHHGVIVSSTGFRQTALRKAESNEIRCLSLTSALSFDWCIAPGVLQSTPHVLRASFRVDPEIPFEGEVALFDAHGNEATRDAYDNLVRIGVAAIHKDQTWQRVEPYPTTWTIEDPNPTNIYCGPKGDQPVRAKAFKMILQIRWDLKLIPFNYHDYKDEQSGETLYTLIRSDPIATGEDSGRIVMIKRPDQPIEVLWQFEPQHAD